MPFKLIAKLKNFAGVAYSRKYLPYTNTVVGSSLMMTGDVIAQNIEKKFSAEKNDIDWKRVGRLGLLGGFLASYQHYFYFILDGRFPGKTKSTVLKKIIIDEAIMGTSIIVIFFTVNGWAESGTLQGGWENTKKLFLPAYIGDLCYWPFFQAINFYYVPGHMRVTYLSCVTILWNIFLCFLDIHKRESEKKKAILDAGDSKSKAS